MKSLHNVSTSPPRARSKALERLWSLAFLLGQGMQQGLAERGLSMARANLIWELQERGPRTQRALSRVLRVTPRNVTGLVDALEADGLVERSAHPSDRRATVVTLTEKGGTLAASMRSDQDGFAQHLFADASAAELESFVGMLDRVLDRVRAVIPADETSMAK